jgi:hypothetical protein
LGISAPGQVQIHDFNPGDLNEPGQPNHFSAGGVVWTRPIPNRAVTVRPGRGNAHFTLPDFSLFAYLNIVNAFFRTGPDPIDATASVDIHWTGTGERLQVDNDTAGFGGQYRNADATIEWSVTNAEGYSFSTANSSETTVTHAFTAHVRSGVFHP